MHSTPSDFTLKPLTPQSAETTNFTSEGLSNITDQFNQALINQNALEVVNANATQAQLKKELKKWRNKEISNVDSLIENALAEQGITKEMLLNNAKLREQVTKWKREAITEFNKNLDTAEQSAIETTQSNVSSSQQSAREELSEVISTSKSDIMKSAGWTGAWDSSFDTYIKSSEAKQATINSALASGLIREEVTGSAGPDEKIYTLSKEYSAYSPSEQATLKTIFNITPEQQKISDLVNSGAIKIENGNLVQNLPYLKLNEQQVKDMSSLGFDLPSWETISKAQALSGDGFVENLPFGFVATIGQIAKDAVSLVNWLTKDADIFNLIPDADIKFSGPSLDTLNKWVKTDLTDADKAFVIGANIALSFAEGVALDNVLMSGLSVAGSTIGKTASVVGKIGNFTLSKTGITKVAAYLANNPTLVNTISKISSFKSIAGSKTANVTTIAKWLTAHPNITGLIVTAPIAGMQVGTALNQLQSGQDPYEVYMQLGKNLGLTAGGLLSNKIYTDYQRTALQDLVKQRMTTINLVHTDDGWELAFTVKKVSDIPKKYASIFETVKDPVTGQWVVTEINQINTGRIFDHIITAKESGSTLAIQSVIKASIGDDGFNTLIGLIGGVKKLSSMSSEDILVAIGKVKNFQNTAKFSGLADTGLAIPDRIHISMDTVYNDLIKAGYTKSDAAYWSAKLISSTPEEIVNTAKNVWKMSNGEIEYLVNSSISSGAINDYRFISNLIKKSNLTDEQTVKLFSIISKSTDTDLRTFARTLTKLDENSLEVAVQLLPEERIIQSTRYMEAPDFSKLLRNTFLIEHPEIAKQALANVEPQVLSKTVNLLTTRDITRVMPLITDDQAVQILAGLRQESFNAVIAGLTTKNPEQQVRLKTIMSTISVFEFAKIASKLDASSLNSIIPYLTTEQWIQVFQNTSSDVLSQTNIESLPIDAILTELGLTPETMQEYLRKEIVPTKTKTKIPPIILKKLLDQKLKQNRKEMEKQKTKMFEVRLFYYSSSEQFKIKADSFHGAAREAINRKRTSSIPLKVIVKKKYEDIK